MNNISTHMRICAVSISDDEVNSRTAAVTSLAVVWGKETNITTLLRRAEDVAIALGGDGRATQSLGVEVQAAIQKKSSAYLYEERPLDVGVCAGMAMVSLINEQPGNSGWTNKDVYATALWLALTYQPSLGDARREKLRREVLESCENWAISSAREARSRSEVKNPAELKITVAENGLVTHNFKAVIDGSINALRRNAALDREELDFLWWAQIGSSRLLRRKISSLNEPTRIIGAAIEGAAILRRLPSEVHREIILRTLNEDPQLDLSELLDMLGEDRAAIGAGFGLDNVTNHPAVFPVLLALTSGAVTGEDACIKRAVSEWGARALVEASLSHMAAKGLRTL
ncbi:GTPase-associated system all-helical protein GASH [Lysobacter enzymogenes]|uniref:GTPase-associated system all-helical protein GASH n=1 Tax=Lysobacter enzymogenes TaxID=69 RepID=UPI00089BBA74|nr:GTPase-associated system all-helical protein GASH [Lysobacter enzymogenes]SDX24593.1 hypothetical protein SAMN05421681_104350 [Lysobacter enzymogenes]